jgi:hypothetical protein
MTLAMERAVLDFSLIYELVRVLRVMAVRLVTSTDDGFVCACLGCHFGCGI